MKLLSKENIIIAFLVVIAFRAFYISADGDSEAQEILIDRIKEQTQIIIEQDSLRNEDKLIIQKFKDEYSKSDSTISNYNEHQTDSFFTEFESRLQ